MAVVKNMIDISYANTVTDWSKVAKNVDAVIIRIGYRSYATGRIYEDAKFRSHTTGAIGAAVPKGFYFMSQAVNEQEAREEADFCHGMVGSLDFDMPVFIDSEWSNNKKNGRADSLSKKQRTKVCAAFCKRLTELGVRAGVYASKSWFTSQLDVAQLTDYYIWCAQYNIKCTAKHRVDIWQHTSSGTVPGIAGRVDRNKCYVCFECVTAEKNPFREPASDVKRGKTGNDAGWVQWYLWRFGLFVDEHGNADVSQVDQQFGKGTQAAVKEAQKRLGMPQTGVVKAIDRAAWKKLC